MNENPLLPYLGKLMEVRDLAADIKLFRVEMQNGGSEAFKTFQPGQFAFVSAFGQGEAPFGIANTCGRGPMVDFAVARLGSVTTGLHELGEGDVLGVRGPLGNWFPMKKFKGKNYSRAWEGVSVVLHYVRSSSMYWTTVLIMEL